MLNQPIIIISDFNFISTLIKSTNHLTLGTSKIYKVAISSFCGVTSNKFIRMSLF